MRIRGAVVVMVALAMTVGTGPPAQANQSHDIGKQNITENITAGVAPSADVEDLSVTNAADLELTPSALIVKMSPTASIPTTNSSPAMPPPKDVIPSSKTEFAFFQESSAARTTTSRQTAEAQLGCRCRLHSEIDTRG
jgi:hypothetical protein